MSQQQPQQNQRGGGSQLNRSRGFNQRGGYHQNRGGYSQPQPHTNYNNRPTPNQHQQQQQWQASSEEERKRNQLRNRKLEHSMGRSQMQSQESAQQIQMIAANYAQHMGMIPPHPLNTQVLPYYQNFVPSQQQYGMGFNSQPYAGGYYCQPPAFYGAQSIPINTHPFSQPLPQGPPAFIPQKRVNKQVNNQAVQQEKQQPKKAIVEASPKELKEIELWIEQRRKRFPVTNAEEKNVATRSIQNKAGEMSELERKLRRKLNLILSQITGKNPDSNKQKRTKPNPEDIKQKPDQEINAKKQLTVEEKRIKKRELKKLRKQSENENKTSNTTNSTNQQQQHNLNLSFKYRKNELLNQILESEQEKEHAILLQAFKYLVENNIV